MAEQGIPEGAYARNPEFDSAVQRLRQSEERYRAFFVAMPDPMFRVNREGVVLDYTPGKENELALPARGLAGKHIQEVLPADIARPAMHHIQQALESDAMQTFEYQLLLENDMRDYEIRMMANGADEVLAIVRNITERKKSERLKNEFVSIVSHELRTPLTSIRGSLSLIAGQMANELAPRVKSMVEIAHKNSERLVTLVNDILDIDKIESGKMVFDLKPTDLVALAEQAVESHHAYGAQFRVSFKLETQLTRARVNADADRIMQVLANLLSNATKFSPPDSTVLVTIARHGKDIRVSVTDQGPGIPEAFRGRIFQKFAQADSSATRQKGGTGLGLSISKAVIERHGGKIGFETETDAGTTFFFELPEFIEEEVTYGGMQNKPRILICEDTPDLATMLSLMLTYNGFNTDIAYNTTQARQLLANNRYAAMTLDLVMPGQSGIDFIRELRSQERTRHLPIVVISAIAQQGREELEGGAFEVADWLDKSVDHGQLVAAIRRAISHRATTRPRILHVEDDTDIFEVLTAMLQEVADTCLARSLADATRLLEQETFNLIILDVGLPDGSGLELLSLLHNPARPPIPVIIFSAREVSWEVAQRVAAVLVKSRTSNKELLETIKSYIGIELETSEEPGADPEPGKINHAAR